MKRLFDVIFMVVLVIAVAGANACAQKVEESSKRLDNITSRQGVDLLSGKVVETMDSGGYTYVSIEKDNNRTWVAIPKMEVKVGQEISFNPGAAMKNYESRTLKRTFDSIIFSSGPVKQKSRAAGMNPAAGKDPHGNIKSSASGVKEKIKVNKASGPNAYTIAELYAKKTALDKKSVVIRGKVVKVSPNIMQKNWIHIQDGSGDPASGSHDIIVLSVDLPSVGDLVTASGTLISDKDIGSGYKFEVIIEQAKIAE